MNLSGVLIVAKPEWVAEVVHALRNLEGIEVYQVDEAGGRIVAVQEAEDINAEVDGLKRIKSLPHVVMAEMVYHYLAEDEQVYEGLPPELAGDQPFAIPKFLQD